MLVVGAGAAGLLAAAKAASRHSRVLLLEKNRKLGVKILMSGGTRCNLTQATDRQGIIFAFGANGRFLNSALATLSPQDVVSLFEGLGVATKTEATGKIFPVSDRALDVRDALVRQAIDSGCQIVIENPAAKIDWCDSSQEFIVDAAKGELRAKRLILTTGGKSYPGCGTTGDGYFWARELGHSIVAPRPALTPLVTRLEWVRALSGVTLEDVQLTLIPRDANLGGVKKKDRIDRRRGSLLMTHFGVSGPAVLDISGAMTGLPQIRDGRLLADLLPDHSVQSLEKLMAEFRQSQGHSPMHGLFVQWLPKRLVESLFDSISIARSQRAAELTKEEMDWIVRTFKQVDLEIEGTKGFKKAEVTAGGVSLSEVDSRTMESKIRPGLFFAGEILDLDGSIGGYNFQSAFSTGWLAGISV